MKSRRANRAYNIQSELKNNINYIYSNAIHFKLTHDDIVDQIREKVYDIARAKKVPQYVISFLDGYWEAKREEVYRNHIVWVLSIDGMLMTSKEVDAWKASKDFSHDTSPWSRIDTESCRHVWKDNDGHPMLDKPFDRRFVVVK
jgi:hypothetical protein